MKNRASLLVASLLLASPGFAQDKPPQAQEEDIVAAAQKTQTPQSVLRMAREIQKQILTLPEYGVFDDIHFGIKDFNVTLKGQASRPILKSSIEKVVKKVEGVEKVDNQIEVLPLSPMDDRIRTRVFVAIYYNPSLSRYNPNRGTPVWVTPGRLAAGITNDPPVGNFPIHIIVKNGNVRLTGVVDNAADAQIAYMQANSVPGAFSVDNELQILNNEKTKKKKK